MSSELYCGTNHSVSADNANVHCSSLLCQEFPHKNHPPQILKIKINFFFIYVSEFSHWWATIVDRWWL